MRRTLAVLSIAGFSLLAACGSAGKSPVDSVSDTSTSIAPSTTVASPTTANTSAGIPASSVPEQPSLVVTVTPSSVAPGATVTFRLTGADLDQWLGGVDTYLDRQINGEWRTIWAMTPTDWGSDAHNFDTDGREWERVAVGLPADRDVTIRIPARATPGEYRICRPQIHTIGDTNVEEYLCAPLTIE